VIGVVAAPESRREAILKAIVTDYVLDGEPVGSKRVVEELRLGVSPATVRADMAVLEAEGYITQPHTSAGRVPTDKGYRFFVDALADTGALQPEHLAALDGLMMGSADIEELLRRASNVLSRLTRYASLVAAPSLDRTRLRHIELVQLGPGNILAILIADTGQVRKRIIALDGSIDDHELQRARWAVNDAAGNMRLTEAPDIVGGLAVGAPPELRTLLEQVADVLADEAAGRGAVERVFVGGGANLVGAGHFDRPEQISELYGMLEQQVVLVEMLRATLASGDPAVRIGTEIPMAELAACSLVASGYELSGDRAGSVGVIGPTRMDYPQTLAAVKAVASSLEHALAAMTGASA
jgi:heat-inducible transcriptional repressor